MLDQLSPTEAVDLTRQVLCDKDQSGSWPHPLLRVLEKARSTLALRWAIVLFQESIPRRIRTGSQRQQHSWLTELLSLVAREDGADYCDMLAHKIWNNDPKVSLLERGIARLYWALSNYKSRTIEPDYYLQLGGAVAMLADTGGSSGDIDEATVERGITLFYRLLAENDVDLKARKKE